jgi:hypothetical protein
MSDRVFFGAAALVAVAMIAMALVWPQGQGAQSPGPFKQPLAQQAPAKPATAPIQ